MREIKFRAWSKGFNRMFYSYDAGKYDYYNIHFGDIGYGFYNPSLELMQFTGLKDKNDKDIYEGDIIKWTHVDGARPTIYLPVVWDKKATGFYCDNGKETRALDSASDSQVMRGEVIGNIYENPELLESEAVKE